MKNQPTILKTFEHEELLTALRELDSVMERCQMDNDYVLLGETAKSVFEDKPLAGSKVEAAVKELWLTPERRTTLRQYLSPFSFQESGDALRFTVGGTPVEVHILPDDYPHLGYPERRVYQYDDYQTPNPFNEYWEARGTRA